MKRQFDFEPEFLQVIDGMAAGWSVEPEDVIRGFCMMRMAQIEAEMDVWEHVDPLLEVARHGEETLKGKELFQILYLQEVAKAEREKSNIHYQDQQWGIPLTKEEAELVKKYHG